MTDFLLIHAAGQGAWSWGSVWGYMTSPKEHPPRLYSHKSVGKVYPLDLPGHGLDSDGDTNTVQLEECVQAVTKTIERQNMNSPILVAHGSAAPIALQASTQLNSPPSRIVLVGGIIPRDRKNIMSEFSRHNRYKLRFSECISSVTGRDVKFTKAVINRSLCNTMEAMDVVQYIGYFGALPLKTLKTRVSLPVMDIPCPVTYLILNDDRLVSPKKQLEMAQRIPGAEIIDIDSCHQVVLHKPKELSDILVGYA